MTWAKLDDAILDNPKVVQVGALGFAWYAAGLVYSNRNLTDGFIPYGVAERLLSTTVIESDGKRWMCAITSGMQGDDCDPRRIVGWLLEAGLWEEDRPRRGYQIHDFLAHNPSRDEVMELRAKRAEAGRRGNLASRRPANTPASAEQVPGKSRSKSPGKTPANLGPVPVPVPTETAETLEGDFLPPTNDLFVAATAEKNTAHTRVATLVPETDDGFVDFYAAYPRKKQAEKARKAWRKLGPDGPLQAKILEAIARQKRWPEWRKDGGQYIPYPASWLNARAWQDEPSESLGPEFDGSMGAIARVGQRMGVVS